MSYTKKIRDVESYRERLSRFLSDKLLRFNPYLISDERLLEGLEKMRWRGPFSLTQMVVLNILDVQNSGNDVHPKERVIYSLGDSNEEISEYISAFTGNWSSADALRQVRSTINDRPITQTRQIYPLIGKRVFVSRSIVTINQHLGYGKAMRMHRMKGKQEIDAAMIRETAVSAKIEMLKRLLAYPYSNIYLDGEPSSPVDIFTPIHNLVTEIASFPTANHNSLNKR